MVAGLELSGGEVSQLGPGPVPRGVVEWCLGSKLLFTLKATEDAVRNYKFYF